MHPYRALQRASSHICAAGAEVAEVGSYFLFTNPARCGHAACVVLTHVTTLCGQSPAQLTPPLQATTSFDAGFGSIAADFQAASGPKERAGLLLKYAERLPHLPAELQTNANRVMGCSAQVCHSVRHKQCISCVGCGVQSCNRESFAISGRSGVSLSECIMTAAESHRRPTLVLKHVMSKGPACRSGFMQSWMTEGR